MQHRVGVAPPSEKQRLGDDAGVDGDERRDARGGSYGAHVFVHLLGDCSNSTLACLVESVRELVPYVTRLDRARDGVEGPPDALADAPPLDDALEALRAEVEGVQGRRDARGDVRHHRSVDT